MIHSLFSHLRYIHFLAQVRQWKMETMVLALNRDFSGFFLPIHGSLVCIRFCKPWFKFSRKVLCTLIFDTDKILFLFYLVAGNLVFMVK